MKTRLAMLGLLTAAFSLSGALASVHGAPQSFQATRISSGATPEKTHVGVEVGRLAVLQTNQVHSGVPSTLYYDGFWNAPFSVPEGYAFVATELIFNPVPGGTIEPVVNGYMIVDGFLRYPIQQEGRGMTAHGLGSGIVFRPGNNPTVYAYSSNVGSFEVTITGYFVEGEARPAGLPFGG
jgi:hypothetical protein